MSSPFTDRYRLVSDAYADASKLSARQDLYGFRRPGPGFHDRLIELVDWSEAATVLDVGCGNAIYLDKLAARLRAGTTVVGVDLSPGMLASASHPSGRIVADAQAVPLRTGAADVVLALHVLHHVPDPSQAVCELRRVARPGCLVVVSSNGPRHLTELIELGDNRVLRGSRMLGLDRVAELLSAAFDSVERHDFIDDLVVTEPEPVVAYLRSTISLGGDLNAVAVAERRVHEALAAGPLLTTVHPGALLCR